MTVDKLISETTPPLRPSDSVEYALGLLMEVRVRHLPVVDDERRLVGLLSEDQLLDASGPEAELSDLLGSPPLTVSPKAHVFEVAKVMMEHGLTTVPVADQDGRFVGIVRRHDLFEWFARTLATQSPGAILALEVEPRDYALSQLVYAIEQNDVRVLSIATESPERTDGPINVTIKLNVRDASRVKHLLEHRGYRVVAAFGEDENDEDLLLRVQEFMRYLEV
jgi:CBS domain-containing protein